MPARTGTAHVVTTTRRYKDQVYRTHLLRRSYREGSQVKNETLGNLSHLPEPLIEIIRRSLQGETFVPVGEAFEVVGSRAHGHVQAVARAMQRLGLAEVIAAKPCRERELVLAMVAARIVAPHTKLATTRWWHTTTLAEDFGVAACDENDLYAAMDWLLARQDKIEKKLAARHLEAGGLVLYDLSSRLLRGHDLSAGQAATTATASAACCRSTTACSPMRAAARWPCQSTRATRSTARRCCRQCSGCKRTSASSSW
jgi:hypothetical protein